MVALRTRIHEHLPTLILLNLAVSGTFCVYAATRFLSLQFSPVLALLCAAIIFGIYSLNRMTDHIEDFSNDTGRIALALHKSKLLLLGISGLGLSFLFLLLRGHLGLYHIILFAAGFAYSVPTIPWFRDGKMCFLKMKQVPLLKNLSVAVLWAVSIFFIPTIYTRVTPTIDARFVLAFVSIMLATFSNTTFNDIRDEAGDRLAGNQTLPVLLGARFTLTLILGTNAVWVTAVAVLSVLLRMPVAFALFLILMSMFTLVYVLAYYGKWVRARVVEMISDLHFAVFATGLLLSSLF